MWTQFFFRFFRTSIQKMRHLEYMSLDSLFFEDGTSPEGIEDGVGTELRAESIPAEVFCLPYLGFATSLVVFARYNNLKL